MKVGIAELHPYEPSVLRRTVAKYVTAYTQDPCSVKPPKVALIDDCWIVRDGNNRVFAAKVVGLTEIDVSDDTPTFQADQIAVLKAALDQAKQKKQQRFENVPVDESRNERSKRY